MHSFGPLSQHISETDAVIVFKIVYFVKLFKNSVLPEAAKLSTVLQ